MLATHLPLKLRHLLYILHSPSLNMEKRYFGTRKSVCHSDVLRGNLLRSYAYIFNDCDPQRQILRRGWNFFIVASGLRLFLHRFEPRAPMVVGWIEDRGSSSSYTLQFQCNSNAQSSLAALQGAARAKAFVAHFPKPPFPLNFSSLSLSLSLQLCSVFLS